MSMSSTSKSHELSDYLIRIVGQLSGLELALEVAENSLKDDKDLEQYIGILHNMILVLKRAAGKRAFELQAEVSYGEQEEIVGSTPGDS